MNKKEILLYVIFGGLTTLIDVLVFYIFNNTLGNNYIFSMIAAWFFAVIFAFLTNKFLVFNSENKVKLEILKELVFFVIARVTSLLVSILFMVILVTVLQINEFISKLCVNILVFITNYIFSKFIIFKKV